MKVKEVLKLSEKYFKEAMIKMLQEAIMVTFETIVEKVKNLSKEIEYVRKNQVGILNTEKHNI